MKKSEEGLERKTIKFLRTKSPYTVGEVATFSVDKADFYIERGIGREYPRKKNKKEKQITSRGDSNYVTK